MAAQTNARPQFMGNNYLPNGGPPPGLHTPNPTPGARPLDPNQGRVVQQGGTRVLCVADVRGDLSSLNTLAKQARADYIIHTGDFGFYDERSLERIADKTLKHVVQYSPLLSDDTRRQINQLPPSASIKNTIPSSQLPLSQLPQFLNGQLKFDVPVYAVWGACEDVQVLEKLRAQEYKVDKLHILDEAHSRLLEVGGIKLRLLGLGGALVMHKLFDNGEGRSTIAGGQGTMWTTLLQMGELIDTANRTYDPSETRVFVTHASPSREGLLNQLAVALKADFSISGGLHFRYGSSYNEFSVNPTLDHFRGKLAASKASFQDVWDTVKSEVEPIVAENEAHQRLLQNALEIVGRMPSVANGGNPFGGPVGGSTSQIDEAAFKNMWNFNLADAAYGWLALDLENGRIGTEMRALGFNFSHRGMKTNRDIQDTIKATSALHPASAPNGPSANAVQNTQPQVSTSTAPAPAAPQPQPQNVQTRPGQQTRPQATQQSSQPRSAQSSAPPSTQQNQAQPQKANTQAARSTSQTPATTSTKPTTAPTTNGASASESKPNGVASPAPVDAKTSTPPPQPPKPSTGIFVRNGPKSEEEVRKIVPEDHRPKIQGVEKIGQFDNWHIKFSSNEEMKTVLNALPQEMKYNSDRTAINVKPYTHEPRRGPMGGYKSGSDTEGGRGGRGGFGGRGRGRGGRGDSERGRGSGGRGRGMGRGAGDAQASSTPASAPAPAGNAAGSS